VDKAHLTQVGSRPGAARRRAHFLVLAAARGRSERLNRPCRIGWSTSCVRLGSRAWTMPIATSPSATCRRTTSASQCRPRMRRARLFPRRASTWTRSSSTARFAAWPRNNTVSADGLALQIARQPGRLTCAGLHVELRRHMDGSYSLRRGARPSVATTPRTAYASRRSCGKPQTTAVSRKDLGRRQTAPASTARTGFSHSEPLAKADNSFVKTTADRSLVINNCGARRP